MDEVTSPSRFRSGRQAAELSLLDVSDLTGLSVSMLSGVERGERALAPRTKVTVARRLGVRVRDLFDVPAAHPARVAS